MPSDFDIAMTERFPDDASVVVCQPGDKCEVMLGGDVVITGYVDRYTASIEKGSHTIRITGRSKSQDLVDCSAEWKSGQFANKTALQVAQNLAEPYGISVSATGDPGRVIPQFNLIIGESPFDIIERVCRYSGLLAYDKPDGSVVLAQTGKARAASGLKQGENVQSATFVHAVDQTFREYAVFGLSTVTLRDAGALNTPIASETDPNVKRKRLKYFVAESGAAGYDLTKVRAKWELARRHGRSWRVSVTTDSWRDESKKLWTPNTLVPVTLPALKVNTIELCVGEVTYNKDERGTTADLVLSPPAAFLPQPVNLLPIRRDVVPPNQGR